MHFDFHAGLDQTGIGENCDPDAIGAMLDAVKPDYVQCDTKGHRGATSYPTKVGYPAPEMKGDILRMWRDETAERDIALYAHHSGVWDDNALLHHPEWAAFDADGKASTQKTSVFGPYCDELLIPQLKEMANEYQLDGAWIDGECWAVQVDYSKFATDEYKKKFASPPPAPDSPDYYQYIKFCRQGFRDYIAHYIEELHKAAPNFQITSNWMYTSFVPEDTSIPLDFISGDYSPNDSVNSARFEGRCIAGQHKPWDLMAWGFSTEKGQHCVKEYEQLCQEAAAVISIGGGFQFYNRQLVGTIQKWAIPMWAKLADFCRERQQLCHKAEAVPQIGVIYSQKAHYHSIGGLFGNWGEYITELRGTLMTTLDAGFSAEILMTHHALSRDLSQYGALIVSDLTIMESDLRAALLDYAENGGNLIICGYNSAQLFLPYLDIDIKGGREEKGGVFIEHGGRIAPIVSPYREVSLSNESSGIDGFYLTDDDTGKRFTAASVTNYGDGKIAGVYFNIGKYAETKSPCVRDFMKNLVKSLTTPTAEIETKAPVELSLMKKEGALLVNLLNLSGPHSDATYNSFDYVPPVESIAVTVKYPSAPASVTFEPEGIALDYTYKNGEIKTTVKGLHIHGVVKII